VATGLQWLTDNAAGVLGVFGSGVTLMQAGRMQLAIAVNPAATELEPTRDHYQRGPCLDAIHTGEIVAISDLRTTGSVGLKTTPSPTRIGLLADCLRTDRALQT